MAKYIAKRVALALVTLVIVSMLTFFLMFLVPGGPFLSEKSPSPAVLAAMEEKYGLDKPVIVQYKNYMLNLLQGELGPSIKQRGRTVAQIIGSRFPVSARIGGIAVPSFVVCTILLYIFSLKLGWLPSYGLTGWKNYIMPVIALGFYPTAYICRLMRSSMLDVLGQEYMRTARAKGLSQGKSLFKHALRNAILPVVTYLGPALAYTLTGSLIVEKIFTIPGLGDSFVSSITGRDYMVIMGTTIFLATLIITMNVIVDIVYKIIDPRIKLK